MYLIYGFTYISPKFDYNEAFYFIVPQCVPTELLPPRRHVQVAPRLCFFVVVAGFAAGFIRWSAGLFALAKAYT